VSGLFLRFQPRRDVSRGRPSIVAGAPPTGLSLGSVAATQDAFLRITGV
jgi:hypothetical protein